MGAEMVSYPDTANYGKKEVHFTDHLGSVRATWSELGERTATEYNPFGSTAWTLNGTKTRTFIGKESDAESNLGDFGARKYDSRIVVGLQV
jgi:hypothetical protein